MALRYFCATCNGRVSPFDSREQLTEAPEAGKSGDPVLLSSYNMSRRSGHAPLKAWCFVCDGWVETYGLSALDLDYRYFERRGVVFRFNGRSKQAFANELESRRANARIGVLTIPAGHRPRRRAS
jgi:hypothetical protein